MPRSTLPPGPSFALGIPFRVTLTGSSPDTEGGGPLGSLGPYLDLPGVWPTKEELKGEAWLGEDPPPPVAHNNYPTAELFASEIEATFYEERALDRWTGPSLGWRRQRGAAANRRNFARAPLRGLMSQTRSGRSTMAQKGEQTHTSRLIRRRRPRHRWWACPWTSPCPWTCSCPSGVVRSPWMSWLVGGPWKRS